jgi:hypothetical protein
MNINKPRLFGLNPLSNKLFFSFESDLDYRWIIK